MLLPPRKRNSQGEKLVRDASLGSASKWLGTILAESSAELALALGNATRTPASVLRERTEALSILQLHRKTLSSTWNARFEELRQLEEECASFFQPASKDTELLQDDSLGQLCFSNRFLKHLNPIPFVVLAISLFKVWVVPAMAVLVPVIAWFLPYLLLKFFWNLPIDTSQYSEIFQHLWAGQIAMPPLGFDQQGRPAVPSMWTPRSIAQFFFFGFSFAQSLLQPIQTAMHLHTTSGVLSGLGRKLLRIQALHAAWREECKQFSIPFRFHTALDEIVGLDPHAAFVTVYDEPGRLHLILRDAAQLELLWRITEKDGICRVEWVPPTTPSILDVSGAADISLETPIASSVCLDRVHGGHAVLTGPNGGGKSSFLRATLQVVLFAHAFGVAPARAVRCSPFAWIASGLNLHDTPGKLSMFETEVQFASDLLTRSRHTAPGLVLFDELFHSTNPPDGIRTAELFLQQLWTSATTVSIVSTHVFSLVENAPSNVQRLCCQAAESGGDIHFSYAVERGICRVSSVQKVWDRFGLSNGSASRSPVAISPRE